MLHAAPVLSQASPRECQYASDGLGEGSEPARKSVQVLVSFPGGWGFCFGKLTGAIGVVLALSLGGCASVDAKRAGALPNWLCVRSTAYTHSEPGGAKSAIGTRLRFGGEVSSAAADWSWLPLGTRFRVQETGRSYVVEDYGSGLVGKRTLDLYMPSDSMMRSWGVRWVTVEILEWGSPAMSRMLLERRRDARPVRQMLAAMEQTKS